MKKILSILLVFSIIFGLAACGNSQRPADSDIKNPDGTYNYKIGIITSTEAQGTEEYQAAQRLKQAYPDVVVTATYPDNFSTEKEQTIAAVTELAADTSVKAIIFVPAVPGAAEAIAKVKETREDLLFIAGAVGENPDVIAKEADICLMVDQIAMGTNIIDQAAKQGAKTFVHISFPRHLEYTMIAARQELFKKRCDELDITYVEATAPDPTGDAGAIGAQAWIIEHISDYINQYGSDTAFFSTNCSMQDPLIQQCAELGAIYPQQCCPSPYHGYPSAFNISDEEHEGDVNYMLEQIAEKVEEYGNGGRMSTWTVAINQTMIEAGYNYAVKWIEGGIEKRCDENGIMEEIKALAGEETTITKYSDETLGELENFFLILCPFYDF